MINHDYFSWSPTLRVIVLGFYLFSSWGNLPLQSYWSLSCDHGLHCSDELTWGQQQTDVVCMWSLVFCGLRIIRKIWNVFFLIRSTRSYTCLHEFKNEVTNRRGKKTPFLNLKKKSIRNSLRHIWNSDIGVKFFFLKEWGQSRFQGRSHISPNVENWT